jgi:hypothetical protein
VPEGDAIDALLVFREAAMPLESTAARDLLGGDRWSTAALARVYVLVDIEGAGTGMAVAAVEVSPTAGSWRVLRMGGDGGYYRRLGQELVRAATFAGASRLVVAPDAPWSVRELLRTIRMIGSDVAGWISIDL